VTDPLTRVEPAHRAEDRLLSTVIHNSYHVLRHLWIRLYR